MSTPAAAVAATSHINDYAVRTADIQFDRCRVIEVWRGVVKLQPEAKYEWFYRRSPHKAPTLLLLTHGQNDTCVGVAGLGTREVFLHGVQSTAGILVDLVVLPDHRTLYPALLLQKTMQATALSLHRIVYGFPNKNSTAIVRRLGYTQVGYLVRHSKVLRHAPYLKRYGIPAWLSKVVGAVADCVMPLYFRPCRVLRGVWRVAWASSVDARFDTLWQRTSGFDGLIGIRDAKFLAWRFFSQPEHSYRVFVVSTESSAEITAYAICEAIGNSMHVRDFLVDPNCIGGTRLLVHLLSTEAQLQGYDNLSLSFAGPECQRKELASAGLVQRETQALYAKFDTLAEVRSAKLEWYLTNADEDS